MKTPLTTTHAQRVVSAISETNNLLNKELSYSADLQKADRIEWLKSHITKLNDMLINGFEYPKFN
jgi:hypothetical protein